MPWRKNRSPYRVLVSELMLQQTSVGRVMTKYGVFLRAFPSFRSLAEAGVREVLATWKGLGYNRRALALRETARIVVDRHHGRLPHSVSDLMELPGIGHATACAIIVYTWNIPLAFIETNIRRVFLHSFFPDENGVEDSRLMPLVEEAMDRKNPRDWYYALMDYGTMLARETKNPNRRSAHYKRQSAFEGSVRQLRGKVLAALLEVGSATAAQITRATGGADHRLGAVLRLLEEEGFLVRQRGGRYALTGSFSGSHQR
jgi:A/G-specific adenine glycosylase